MAGPNVLYRFWKICFDAVYLNLKTELNEKKIHGVDLVRETKEKVKSYADLKRKEIEFQISDKVFLKVSFWKKVLRFGRKGKVSPQFIGPYEIIERIGPVAYRLALAPELDKIHNVFHPDMTYNEKPIKILARETKELRNKKVALVKVLWQKHGIEEAT
ncbi:integrase [Gossypium australe]|uniref:Integrase n=1 Tax=Gossypium australe TaxID=47621 RepID=A0A5B6WTK2_9ROSI|nr:integrase [Gossypium australe]